MDAGAAEVVATVKGDWIFQVIQTERAADLCLDLSQKSFKGHWFGIGLAQKIPFTKFWSLITLRKEENIFLGVTLQGSLNSFQVPRRLQPHKLVSGFFSSDPEAA